MRPSRPPPYRKKVDDELPPGTGQVVLIAFHMESAAICGKVSVFALDCA
jgi:hypothetical protein